MPFRFCAISSRRASIKLSSAAVFFNKTLISPLQRNQNTAVIFEGKSIQIDSSSMSDNHADRVATNGGGALLVRNQANATILNTIFLKV